MSENQKRTVRAIIATLDKVQVSGAKNWEKLLACVQALEDMAEEGEVHEDQDK